MSINQQEELMLHPEQLVVLSKLEDSLRELNETLETYKKYNIPEELIQEQESRIERRKVDIDKARQDFEKANFDLLAVTSRKRGNAPVVKKIDAAIYARTMLPAIGERQDLGKSLELLTAFAIVIDAEVVDKAKKLIELDKLNQYNVMDCVRAINTVVDRKRGWLDRDNGGKLTELIQTLQPEEEVEFEVEDDKVDESEEDETLPLPDTTVNTSEEPATTTTTTRRKKLEATSESEAA